MSSSAFDSVNGGHHYPPPRVNEEEIQRGLEIDFFKVEDPMLLASWASFFRDQYLIVCNQHRYYGVAYPHQHHYVLPAPARGYKVLLPAVKDENAMRVDARKTEEEMAGIANNFVHRFITEVLPSRAMHRGFELHPFNSPGDLDAPPDEIMPYYSELATDTWRVIAAHLKDFEPTREMKGTLWTEYGVGRLVESHQRTHRDLYAARIRKLVDHLLDQQPKERRGKVAIDLSLETGNGLEIKPSQAVATIYSMIHAENLKPNQDVLMQNYKHLSTKEIKEYFSRMERAFVLTVIRKQLVASKFLLSPNASFEPRDVKYMFKLMNDVPNWSDVPTEKVEVLVGSDIEIKLKEPEKVEAL